VTSGRTSETDEPSESPSEPHANRETALERVRSLSRLLDNAVRVPGTDYRIGLDPLVGLLPVVGDVPTTAASAYVVLEAARLGVPRETLARMALNLAVDAVFGSIPLVGDLFDAVWKANARNVALLEARLDEPDAGSADRRYLLAAGVGLLAVLLALSWAAVWLLVQLFGAVGSSI
jgi:hypothetical protein